MGRAHRAERSPTIGEARGVAEATPPPPIAPSRILAVSTGAPFDRSVIQRVVELAAGTSPKVYVLSIAKIWGTSLGFPHPGLYPSKREVEEQKRIIRDAARELKRRGLEAKVRVIASRKAAKTISSYAAHIRCKAIVMADPALPRWRRVVEGSAAADVAKRTPIPVYAVPVPAEPRRARRAG